MKMSGVNYSTAEERESMIRHLQGPITGPMLAVMNIIVAKRTFFAPTIVLSALQSNPFLSGMEDITP